ncbi:MAG: hypothetical protein K8Q99_02800 [Acholeplasmataceae bacterium]|nr:hypothetical protein [Acholeplasmataceae bacterium]
MKKIIFNVLSVLIVIICVIFLVAGIINPIEEIEAAISFLSISILFSVFLAAALFNLLRKD